MASIIIPASKSLTVINKLPNQNINSNFIKVGCKEKFNYISYLYFDISSIPDNSKILSAELVLFKTNNFYDDKSKRITIYQLKDYFSSYTTYNNRPSIDSHIKKAFCPFTSDVAITIDIKKFVVLWIKDGSICTGIMLEGESGCKVTELGSSKSNDSYIIPFIKVNIEACNEKCCKRYCDEKPTITEVDVTGTVAPRSKYEAAVEVEVTRKKSGNKDSYYVTDEYDNTLSDKPLHIDKTYKIAIIPREKSGDTENVNFYGAYKE